MPSNDKKKIMHQLKIAKGQIEGVIKMIDSNKHCMEVLTQIAATGKILKNASSTMIEHHLQSCIGDAKQKDKKSFNKKLEELVSTLRTFF